MDGRMSKRMNALTLPDVLATSLKNLMNFGSQTPEFTTVVWQPF